MLKNAEYPYNTINGKDFLDRNFGLHFGFNGKESDNEGNGNGNQQDYGMRIYDNRLGRFLSTDPITKNFCWWTPYQFAGNTPIWAIDLDGFQPIVATVNIGSVSYHLKVSRWHKQEIQITPENGQPIIFDLGGSKQLVSRNTWGQLPQQLTSYFDDGSGSTINPDNLGDYNKMINVIHGQLTVRDVVDALLNQNPQLSLIIIGNHQIIQNRYGLMVEKREESVSPDPRMETRSLSFERDFTYKRANFVASSYLNSHDRILPVSRIDLSKINFLRVDIGNWQHNKMGINMTFRMGKFRVGKKTEKTSSPKLSPRFL